MLMQPNRPVKKSWIQSSGPSSLSISQMVTSRVLQVSILIVTYLMGYSQPLVVTGIFATGVPGGGEDSNHRSISISNVLNESEGTLELSLQAPVLPSLRLSLSSSSPWQGVT